MWNRPISPPLPFLAQLPYDLKPLVHELRSSLQPGFGKSCKPARELSNGVELMVWWELIQEDDTSLWTWCDALVVDGKHNGSANQSKHLLRFEDGTEHWTKLNSRPHYFKQA